MPQFAQVKRPVVQAATLAVHFPADGRAEPRALRANSQRRRSPIPGWSLPDVARRLERSFRTKMAAVARRKAARRSEQLAHARLQCISGPDVNGPSCGRQVALKLAVLTPHPRAHDPRDAANLLS